MIIPVHIKLDIYNFINRKLNIYVKLVISLYIIFVCFSIYRICSEANFRLGLSLQYNLSNIQHMTL
jgi:hypothetical protein